jgi:hypothetical protein
MAEPGPGSSAEAESGGPAAAPARRPRLPTLDEARPWIGMRIDGLENRALGRAAGLLVDVDDGQPRWVVVRVGPIAGCTAIPFAHVAEGAGRLWAAYERSWVRQAPRFRPDEALLAGDERDLCAHWGIREDQGRAAEVKGRPEDQVSSVPAE